MNVLTDEALDELRDEAWRYQRLGWRLVPLSVKDKKALIPWADLVKHPTAPEILDDWFTNGVVTAGGSSVVHTFNLGIATGAGSGLVVLDCDSAEVYDIAQRELGWRSCVTVKTRKGWHMYFKHPGGRVQNFVGGSIVARPGVPTRWPALNGLDLRGDGGYVVAPPSFIWREGEGYIGRYEWVECDIDNMPMWRPYEPSTSVAVPAKPFTGFADLDLSGISTEQIDKQTVLLAIDELVNVQRSGAKLKDGEGRNEWLAKYAGDRLRVGVSGQALREACLAFQDEFFAERLPYDEIERTIKSIEDTDRRNHPEKYAVQVFTEEVEEGDVMPSYLRPLVYSDLPTIKPYIKEAAPILDPWIVPGEITQVVGFSGHGKSLIIMGACFAIARGEHYGPFRVAGSRKVAYFDFELGAASLHKRMNMFGKMIGPPPDDKFFVVSASLPSDWPHRLERISIDTEAGFARLGEWVKWHKPDVIVIDTVRSAAPGLDENSAPAWAKINQVSKACRDTGAAVIIVHHRNKPGGDGLGREAGSTAQLTDLDTQVIVTAVYEDAALAKQKAGLHAEALEVHDIRGSVVKPTDMLARAAAHDEVVRSVFQITYGKTRNDSYNHTTEYLGFAEGDYGRQRVLSTLTPRMKALALHARGIGHDEIRLALHVPRHQIEQWVKEGN